MRPRVVFATPKGSPAVACATKPDTMPTVARKLLELIRFSHTIFALPFAALAAALAWKDEPFRWQDGVGILLCMVFARSAAMDGVISERTTNVSNSKPRPIVGGTVIPGS